MGNKPIKSWEPLHNYTQAGQSIWYSHQNSFNYLNSIPNASIFIIDPFKGTITVKGEYESCCCCCHTTRPILMQDIPYIDYPINTILTLSRIPPAIRIAREDLFSSRLFNGWLNSLKQGQQIIKDKVGGDVESVISGYTPP